MNVRLILAVSRALLNDMAARRKMMFYVSLITLVLLFGGAVVFPDMLRRSPWLFLGYWAVCLFGTVFMILMALYDLLAVRARHRAELRKLNNRMRDIVEQSSDKPDGRRESE